MMALCSEAAGGELSGSEAGSNCLQFGVRSYLHHFYEECSSSVWDRDPEDQGFVQSQRSIQWNSVVWKVSLALGFLILTAGIVSLAVSYSTPHRIESFGEGDLFFVDARAISFNRELHLSAVAGIGLSCLGLALVVMWAVVRIFPRANIKEMLFQRQGKRDRIGEWRTKWRGFRDPGEVVTKSPGMEEGKKLPVTLSKVENVQPTS